MKKLIEILLIVACVISLFLILDAPRLLWAAGAIIVLALICLLSQSGGTKND